MRPITIFGLAVLGYGSGLALATRDARPASFKRPKRFNGGLAAAPLRRKPATGKPPVVANPCLPHPAPSPEGIDTRPLLKDLSYEIELSLGYPTQKVSLAFDTGSSETWVDPYCSEWIYMDSPTYAKVCAAAGAYQTQQSDTAVPLNLSAEILYGSGAVGLDYWRDVLTFPESNGSSFSLRRVQFGVATSSESMTTGLFGASFGKPYNQNYSGVIDELYAQGYIADRDFSLGLGSVDQEKGEILFGGYDTAKFTGPLVGIGLAEQQEDDDYFRYWINNTYMGVTQPGYYCESTPLTPPGYAEPMLPDSGTTLTYLPGDVFESLVGAFPGAYFNADVGLYQVFCDYLWMKGTVDFGFGPGPAITIHVPFHEFLYQIDPMEENNYTASCFLGAVPSFGFSILGDTFLRSAYLLFRQDARAVHVAQAAECGANFVSSHGNLTGVVGDCAAGFGGADDYATKGCSTLPWTSSAEPTFSIDWEHVAGLDRTKQALQPHLPTGLPRAPRPATVARLTRAPAATKPTSAAKPTSEPSRTRFKTVKKSTTRKPATTLHSARATTTSALPSSVAPADPDPSSSSSSPSADDPTPYGGDESSSTSGPASTSSAAVVIPLAESQTIEIFEPDTTILIVDGSTVAPGATTDSTDAPEPTTDTGDGDGPASTTDSGDGSELTTITLTTTIATTFAVTIPTIPATTITTDSSDTWTTATTDSTDAPEPTTDSDDGDGPGSTTDSGGDGPGSTTDSGDGPETTITLSTTTLTLTTLTTTTSTTSISTDAPGSTTDSGDGDGPGSTTDSGDGPETTITVITVPTVTITTTSVPTVTITSTDSTDAPEPTTDSGGDGPEPITTSF